MLLNTWLVNQKRKAILRCGKGVESNAPKVIIPKFAIIISLCY